MKRQELEQIIKKYYMTPEDSSLLRDMFVSLDQYSKEKEGIRIFLEGKKRINVSSSILETTTYGYGDLDFNGFWEYPVPELLVKKVTKMREYIKKLQGGQ